MALLPSYGDPRNPYVRAKYAYLQSGVSLAGNISLFSAKLVMAVLWSSVAVLGDALNQLTDVAVSIIIILSFTWSKKEADTEHPFGHERIEQVLAVVVATMLVFMGIFVLVEAAPRLVEPAVQGSVLFSLLVLSLAPVKLFLAALSFSVARRIDSHAVRADGWNHVSDFTTTIIVGITVFLVSLGSDYRVLDPILGIAIGFLIIYAGVKLVRSSGDILVGRAPKDDVMSTIVRDASSVRGVEGVHAVEVHEYGSRRYISMHVVVEDNMSLRQAHYVASRVEEAIERAMRSKASVHVEPASARVDTKNLERLINSVLNGAQCNGKCEDLRVHHTAAGGEIRIVLDLGKDGPGRFTELAHKLEKRINSRYPQYHVVVTLKAL